MCRVKAKGLTEPFLSASMTNMGGTAGLKARPNGWGELCFYPMPDFRKSHGKPQIALFSCCQNYMRQAIQNTKQP